MPIPWKIVDSKRGGKEWEAECLRGFEYPSKQRLAKAGRYGVSAFFNPREKKWTAIPSYPDIEGALHGGRQFIFDCKTVTASVSMQARELRDKRKRQLEHMLERSSVGVVCFFAIYFGPWETKTDYFEPSAWCLPVWPDHELWKMFENESVSNISRFACEEYGVPIVWHTPKGTHKPRPDMLSAIHAIAEKLDSALGMQRTLF